MGMLGILALNRKQEEEYFSFLGRESERYKINLFYFTPEDIDFETATINGVIYDNGNWYDCETSYPDLIYDRCFYPSKETYNKYATTIARLQNESSIPFLGYGLPDKWTVYQTLIKDKEIEKVLPETKKITKSKGIKPLLTEYQAVLLKPATGSQGKGIFSIKRDNTSIRWKIQRPTGVSSGETTNETGLYRKLDELCKKTEYLCQPLLPLVTTDNSPFDLRILLQKDGTGGWIEQGRAIRVGLQNALASNLAQGGVYIPYEDWMSQYNPARRLEIEDKINLIISNVPPLLEREFRRLFEIGIDIGIDKSGSVWLLEVNSKPGHKVIQSISSTLDSIYKSPFEFSQYLLNR